MSSTLELLQSILPYIEDAAKEGSGYGYFCGGDPRKFFPDAECCSPEELAAHKAACAAADADEQKAALPCESGWIAPDIHITKSAFGIGTYTYCDDAAVKLLAELKEHIAKEQAKQPPRAGA